MRGLVHNFESYLLENLGISSSLEPWSKENGLPIFLRDLYRFYTCKLLEQPFLVMAARDKDEVTPVTIRKHIERVGKIWQHEVIYLHPTVSSYNRKRLIEHKISFVVPGNQMYLPLLGMDLREHIRSIRIAKKKFSPSTQAVILSILYNWKERGITPSQLAKDLNYTKMTMTRAFDEIEAADLADVSMEWRERVLRFDGDRKSLWKKAFHQLRTPTSQRVKVLGLHNNGNFPMLLAGESALARSSMLVEPQNRIYAVSAETWKAMQLHEGMIKLAIHELNSIEIEIWKYPPELFASNDTVDPYSLFLSLKDIKDERVEMALEELQEKFPW